MKIKGAVRKRFLEAMNSGNYDMFTEATSVMKEYEITYEEYLMLMAEFYNGN